MPKIKIDRDDLIQALTFNVDYTGSGWYLDSKTGRILLDCEDAEDLPVDLQENPRYRWIEPFPSHEAFQVMEDFIATLDSASIVARLMRALDGRKPFRRFKDELMDFPELREAWFQFEYAAHSRMAEAWCKQHRIDVEWA